MQKNTRNFYLLFSVFCFALFLAACSGDQESANGEEGTDNDGEASDGKVEIRFAWWGNTERDKKYNEILDLYEEQNPNVSIIREPSTWNDYWTKLSTQAAGGNAPDLFGLHLLLYGNEYFTKDTIEPLDSYVDSGIISLEGWDQSVLEAGTYNDQLLALAKGVTIQAMLTNVTKLEEVGMEPPPFEISYQDFKDYAGQLVEKLPEGEYVTTDPTMIGEHGIEMWVRQKGGAFLSEDGSELGFSKEDLKSYWEYWNEMRDMGAIPPAKVSAEQAGVPEESTLFAQGKSVFMDRPTNQTKLFDGLLQGDEIKITRYPIMEDGEFKGGEQLQVPAIVMSKNSKVKDEAAKLLNFFVNDLEATEIYSAENGIPGTQPVRDNLQSSLHEKDVLAVEHMEKVVEDIPPTTIRPEGAVQVFTAYSRNAEAVAFGQLTVDEAVDAFFKEAEQILAQ
ncbi:ABC transporter substrate-binding protein [Sediminibacillus massiliensis]|uniref:ABC transporter substrate-binding protein n=1 Tax=Sediminibacillus massiliensis TaxID=1926277 RepID=UPI0015C36C8F|nr:extracellular solute-binding protein [Sediminibacillus massiliensis]